MTDEERKKVLAQIVADPEKFKRELREKALRENPKLTEEQLEATWEEVSHVLGH